MSEVEQQAPLENQPEPSAPPEEEVSPAPVVPPPQSSTEGRQERRDRVIDSLSQYLENAIEDDRIAQDEILNSEGNHTGIDYNEVMSNLPDEAKKLMANMRSDYTRKTMELSQERKALEKMRESLATNDEFNKQLDEAVEEDFEFNPYDESSFQKAVEREVAQKLKEMMKPVRQQHELNTRKLQLEQFKSQHPDLTDYKHDVAKLLMSDESLSLEKAYWIIKGQKLSEQRSTQAEELTRYREAARSAGLKVGGSSRARSGGIPDSVKAQGSWAIYQYIEANKK